VLDNGDTGDTEDAGGEGVCYVPAWFVLPTRERWRRSSDFALRASRLTRHLGYSESKRLAVRLRHKIGRIQERLLYEEDQAKSLGSYERDINTCTRGL
jgi:hypothetical protein